MSALILSGDVFIKRTGVDDGFLKLLNAKKFTIKVNAADVKKRTSFGRANYGALLNSYAKPGTHEVAVESDEFDRDTIAMAFLGTSTTIDTAAVVAGSAPVVPVLNQWVEFNATPVTSATTNVGAVLGTDFELDLQGGLYKALTPTGMTATSMTINADATEGYTVAAQTVANLRCEVMLLGVNLSSGEKVKFYAGSATLSPSGDVNLLAEDFNTFTLSGGLEIPTGETVPYTLTVTG